MVIHAAAAWPTSAASVAGRARVGTSALAVVPMSTNTHLVTTVQKYVKSPH